MNIFALSSLLASVVTTFLGIFVLFRNPRSEMNRVFCLYCLAGAFWSFAEFGYRQAGSFATALFWLRAGTLAIFAVPLELHFVMCFTEKTKYLKRKSTYLLLYVPAVVFSGVEVTGLDALHPVRAYWGWTYYTPQQSLWSDLIMIWVVAISFYGLFLCLQYYRRETDPKKKQRIIFVSVGISIPVALALMTEPDGLFYYLNIRIPELTAVGFALECVLLAYAIWKYALFPLTPASAAESIIATLTDALFLVNSKGEVATVNQATLELLGYEASELLDQPIEIILVPEETANFRQSCLEQLLAGDSICDTEITLVTKDGRKIPVSLSASVVRDEEGVEPGIVYVGRDLTERKQAEEQIKASLREKEILLKEIHHRVKNNLQIISSLFILQSGDTRDKQVLKVLRESQNRVYSMAVIHEIL